MLLLLLQAYYFCRGSEGSVVFSIVAKFFLSFFSVSLFA